MSANLQTVQVFALDIIISGNDSSCFGINYSSLFAANTQLYITSQRHSELGMATSPAHPRWMALSHEEQTSSWDMSSLSLEI